MHPDEDWPRWFDAVRGRAPRPDFLAALAELGDARNRSAVDLGAGDGTESRWLLDRGWRVLAIDGTPGLRERILDGQGDTAAHRLTAIDAAFAEVTSLPSAALVYAGLSLPFGTDEEVDHILRLVRLAIGPDGLFAGHFFGERDSWASRDGVIVHTEEELRRQLADFDLASIDEQEFDGPSGVGQKHWHIRFVMARSSKRAPERPELDE